MDTLLAWDTAAFLALNGLDWGVAGVMLFQAITLTCHYHGSSILALIGVGLWLRRRRMAVMLVLTIVCSMAVNGALKHTFERQRPLAHFNTHLPETLETPGWGETQSVGPVLLRTRPLQKRSFPSGHAQHAFAWMVFIALLWRRGAPLFLLVAGGVALSRVVLGVHFPWDVCVGAVLGTGFGVAGFSLGAYWEARAVPLKEETP